MTLLRRQTNINNDLFGIVVMVAVQSAFRLEIHQNIVFFLKKLFLTLAHQNDQKTLKNLF